MKAISIRPPWAWAILYAGKNIENRTWKTNMRGTVAIHASRNMTRPYYEWALDEIRKVAPRARVTPYEAMTRGAIIGLMDIISCEKKTKSMALGQTLWFRSCQRSCSSEAHSLQGQT